MSLNKDSLQKKLEQLKQYYERKDIIFSINYKDGRIDQIDATLEAVRDIAKEIQERISLNLKEKRELELDMKAFSDRRPIVFKNGKISAYREIKELLVGSSPAGSNPAPSSSETTEAKE